MPQGACRGYGTIRPATSTDCRYAESIHHICHTGLLPAEPPKRIFGSGAAMEVPSLYCGLPTVPQGACRGCGTIRPATPTDCRYAESIHHICHTGLLPAEPPKRSFRVWGRHGGPILVLRATHSATGCVPWVWNDQTGNTNRLPIRRVEFTVYVTGLLPAEPPKRIFRVSHTPSLLEAQIWEDNPRLLATCHQQNLTLDC